MSQTSSSSFSSREDFFSPEDYQIELELFGTEEQDFDQMSSVKKKRRLAESMVSSSVRDLQNGLTSLRSTFGDLSFTQFQQFYLEQRGAKLDPEEFSCQDVEGVLKQLASQKKCLLAEHKEGSNRICTEVKDCDIVTGEILEKNEEGQKLFKVGHQDLFKVSTLEKSVTEVWIHHITHEAKRIKLEEEMSEFYQCPPLHYQVQSLSQCAVGRLLAAKYNQTVVRVVVVQTVLRAENKIKVRHVDYGDTQEVNIHELFFLDRKFLSCPSLVSKVEFRFFSFFPHRDL